VAGCVIAIATFSRTQQFSVMFGVDRRCIRTRALSVATTRSPRGRDTPLPFPQT